MVYLGACLIAGIRLARERQVNVHVVPTGNALEESVDLAYEVFNRVFRRSLSGFARTGTHKVPLSPPVAPDRAIMISQSSE
jgi:hypothetical protein